MGKMGGGYFPGGYPPPVYGNEAPGPPYSPYSYSYPYRFYYPYYHNFSYGSGFRAPMGCFPSRWASSATSTSIGAASRGRNRGQNGMKNGNAIRVRISRVAMLAVFHCRSSHISCQCVVFHQLQHRCPHPPDDFGEERLVLFIP